MQKIKAKDQNVIVGITHGDFNGISYEIIIKAFTDNRMLDMMTPIVYGSSKIASYYRKALNNNELTFNLIKKAELANPKRTNIINCCDQEVKIDMGKPSAEAGELAFLALERAIEDLKKGVIDVLVTAPINKVNIQSEKFNFPGHTEYLASKFESKDNLMIMVSDELRIGVITGHIPLKDVSANISEDLIINKIKVMHDSLIKDFGIRKPKIAILGLNPHASDDGLIGKEENELIIPAIEKAKSEKMLVFGPFAADGFFGSSAYTKYDGILAMYHDQGMLPFKALSFDEGINFTAGLPIVRTSPAHGTAYDIAGQNIASPHSLRRAIYLAIDIFRNRLMDEEINENPLPVNGPDENHNGGNRQHQKNGDQNNRNTTKN
jgi:4-hydroxythreonine-4-phosphate dehydrogenase